MAFAAAALLRALFLPPRAKGVAKRAPEIAAQSPLARVQSLEEIAFQEPRDEALYGVFSLSGGKAVLARHHVQRLPARPHQLFERRAALGRIETRGEHQRPTRLRKQSGA